MSRTQPIIALEKRIAFDGAAVAVAAKVTHAAATIDAARDPADPAVMPQTHKWADTSAKTNGTADPSRGSTPNDLLGHRTSAPTADSKSVVFIESDVPDIATLIKDISPSATIVMLDASKDGVDAITNYLKAHQGVENVYIFSHGSEGSLSLGTATLDSVSMQGRYAADLATIKASLAANANLLVYGCDFAENADGDSAAHLLLQLTGANVAASTNLTGGTAEGGDFILEDQVGPVTAPNILDARIATDYDGLLAAQNTGAFTITTGTSGSATSSSTVATATTADGAVKVVVTVTPNSNNSSGSITTLTNGATFDTTAPSGTYTTAVNGASALEQTLQFGGATGGSDGTNSATITIAYYDAKTGAAITVTNPIIDIDRLGGATPSGGKTLSVSSDLTLTTSGATLAELSSSSSAFNVTSSDIYGTVNTTVASNFSADASSDPTKGTSAGTVEIVGSVQTVTFNWARAAGSLNGGDRLDFIFQANTAVAPTGTLAPRTFNDGQSGVSIATAQGFSNPSGLPTTYSVSGLPKGLAIDPNTGIISGTIDHDASKNAPSTTGSGANLDGTYTIVVTATNDANNTATQTFTIDSKNQAPTLGTTTVNQTNSDGDTIATVDASKAFTDTNGDPLTYTAAGLPAGLGINSAGLITGTIARNATPGTDSIVVTATDDKGAATTESFNWVVKDVAPTASGTIPNQTYEDGQSGISITTSSGFTDTNGNALTYSVSGLPAGLSINAATGQITGTIDHDASKNAPSTTGSGATLDGTYTVVVTANDGLGGAATQSFTIDSTNQAPTVGTKTVSQINNDGDSIAPIDASKAFADPNGDPLTFSATGLPPGLTISAAGLISGTVAKNATPGTYSVTVTGTDDKGAVAAETFNWVVKDVAPTASSTIPNQSYKDGQSGISITTSSGFSDSNGNALTYSATGLPAGLTINANTGQITGTVDHDASKNAPKTTGSGTTLDGTYSVTVTASDGLGGTATQTFTIDSTNQAPTVGIKTVAQTNYDGDTITTVDASKAFTDPNGDPLAFSATNLPPGLTISAAGVISGTVAKNAAPGPYAVVVSATDDKGAVTTETFNWLIKDVPPAASGTLPNQSYTDGQAGISIATSGGFTDPNGNALTYTATGLPAGLSIDATSGQITGTMNSNASKNAPTTSGSGANLYGTYNVTVTVSDGLGGTATQTFKIDSRNQAPAVGTKTADQSNYDGDTITAVDASKAFANPTGATLTYSANNLPSGLSISANGLITGTIATNATPGAYSVIVSATDTKGATTAETFNWTVKDVVPTTSGTLPNQSYADGQSGISIATSGGFADSNGNPLTYSVSGLPAGLSINAATGQITGTIDHDASKNAPTTAGSGATLDGTYTVTVTASDGLGGTATQTFTIDSTNQAPTVAAAIPDQTSKDSQTITPVATAASFADPNGDPMTYSASNLPAGLSIYPTSGQITGTISSTLTPGTYRVRVLATDDKGAVARNGFNWVIQDAPPSATGTLANQTYADSTANIAIATASGFANSNGLALTYTASGLPAGLSIDPTSGQITGQLGHDASKDAPATKGSGATLDGTYTVIVTASDGQGGTATQTFTIDATNTAPVGTALANQSAADGGAASIDTSTAFSDANTGDILTYSATGLPKGVSINTATGLIAGTIDKSASAGSPYSVTVTAVDDKGASATETFQWTIQNVAPTATPPLADRSAYDGSSVSYATSGGFTNPNGLPLTYSATGLPQGLAIDPSTGIISGTLNHDASVQSANGAYTIAVTVNDGQGGTATNTFHLVASNQAPTIASNTSNQASVDGQTIVALDASTAFADPNGDPLTFSASNLPTGLSIDATGKITGTVSKTAMPGAYTVAVTATDDKGLGTTESFTWTISDAAPIASGSIPARSFADSTGGIAIATAGAFTSPNNLPLTYSATGMPPGLSIDPTTGQITGQLDHDASKNAPVTSGTGASLDGTYTVVVTANDGQGGTASRSFTIDATNTAPAIVAATPNQTSYDGNGVSVDASAAFTDANIGDTLSYTVSGLPKGLTINASTGMITGTVDKSASTSGPYSVAITATDDKGAATTESFTWTIADVVPVVAQPLLDQAAHDAASISYPTAGAFSNPNNLAYTYSATGLPTGVAINPTTGVISGTLDHDASTMVANGSYTIAVTVNDGQGGTAAGSFHLVVTDQAPIVGTKTAGQSNSAGQAISTLEVSQAFSDPNTGDTITYTASNLPSGLSIDPASGHVTGTIAGTAVPGTYAVIVTATDNKGLATTETFNWIVSDVAPGLGSPIANQSFHDSASGIAFNTASGFTSPNNLPLTYSATDLPSGLMIDPRTGQITGTLDHDASIHGASGTGTYQVVVTASDGEGGTAQQTFAITSTNDTPTITAQTPDQVSTAGNPGSLDVGVAFSDQNLGDKLTYTASNLPTGLTLDPNTGLVSGTIASGAANSIFSVTVTATDDKGAAVTESFHWTIEAVPPTNVAPIPNLSTFDGSAVSIDTAGNFSGSGLTYSASGLPAGLTIDPSTGQIVGTIASDASSNAPTKSGSGATLDGFYNVTVTATDSNNLSAVQTFTIDSANRAPVVGAVTAKQSTPAGQAVTPLDASTAFSDPNGDILTYSASELPSGLSINATTGQITGTVGKTASPGDYPVVVVATDPKGASVTETFTWTVTDVAPTTVGSLVAQSFADSTSGISIGTASGFSSPNGLPLTFTATGLPAGLSINPETGVITGQLEHDASNDAPMKSTASGTLDGTYSIVVSASDGQGGITTQRFTIDATNTAPIVGTKTANQQSADSSLVSVDASAAFSDPNTGDVLTYSASNLPSGLSIDPTTGLISGTITKTASVTGSYATTVTATDDKGAATTEAFTWTVADLPPVAMPPLANQGVHDGDTISFSAAAGFVNPNSSTLSYSATGLPKGLTIDTGTGIISGTIDGLASTAVTNGTYSVAVTASDGQGGTATNTFLIVSTNLAPVVGTKTADIVSSNGQTIAPVDASTAFSDPDHDPLTYSASNLPTGLTIDPNTGQISGTIAGNAMPGANLVTVTATDDKGAAAAETFIWTVDNVAPIKNGSIAAQTLADGATGVSIATAQTFVSPNGSALVFGAAGLPEGLSIDPKTGVITGYIDHDASKNAPMPSGQSGAYSVTVTATDQFGGSVAQTFTIDTTNQAPVIGTTTANQHSFDGNTAAIDASAAFADPNLGDVLSYTATGLPKGLTIDPTTGLISGTIDKSASIGAPYSVAVTATDDKGAAVTETFSWSVDNIAPAATPPLADRSVPDGTIVSYATVGGFTNPNSLPFTYTATGLPTGLTIDPSSGVISGTLDREASTHGNGGAYTIDVTVDDGQGGTATNTFVLTATNQAAIVVAKTANVSGQSGQPAQPVDTSKAFADPNGDVLTYSASNLPSGLAIDPSSGVIDGTVAANTKPGVYSVTVTAVDDKGAANSETFLWTIDGVPPAPQGSLANVSYPDGVSGVSIGTASGFTSPNGLPLTFSATGLPTGLSIDSSTGVISGFVGHDSSKNAPATSGAGATLEGKYTAVVTATDEYGGAATQSFKIVTSNQAPTLGTATANQRATDGSAVSLDAARSFADPNIGDVLTFSASNLPKGLSINPTSGLISGTIDPRASTQGPYNVLVTATDDKMAATTESFVWTVADAAPTTTASIAPVAGSDGVAIAPVDAASAFSSPNGLPLTYSARGLPKGLSIDPTTGVITGTIDRDASLDAPSRTGSGGTLVGIYSVTITASDGQGGTSSQRFTIDAANAAPVVIAPNGNQISSDGQTISPIDTSHAFQDPNGDPLTFSATGLPPGLAVDPATGALTGTVSPDATPGAYRVIVTATDDKGASGSETFVWTVADSAARVAPSILPASDMARGVTLANLPPVTPLNNSPPMRNALATNDLRVGGVVLDTVHQISGDPAEAVIVKADGIVVNTVNALRPLDGLQPIDVPNNIIRNSAATDVRGDRFARVYAGHGDDIAATIEENEAVGASLRASNPLLADDSTAINVETLIRDRNIFISVDNRSPTACVVPVTNYVVTAADGSALPSWLHVGSEGFVSGRIPVGVEGLDLKVAATLANGVKLERHVTISTTTGVISPVTPGSSGRHHASLSFSQMVAASRDQRVARVAIGHLLD